MLQPTNTLALDAPPRHRSESPPADPASRIDLVVAMCGVAVAGVSAGSTVNLVGWSQQRALRVAQLPEVAWVVVASAAAALTFALLSRFRTKPAHAGPLRHVCRALGTLNVLALPFLPVLADHAPALVMFQGPLGALIVAAVALACVQPWLSMLASGLDRPRASLERSLFVLSLALFIGAGFWVTRVQGLGGDEPHYLVIAESLRRDGDLAIENNHDNRDYESFFEGHLPPHSMRRGRGDVLYSIHAPGLPTLLLPAYSVAGVTGAYLTMALLAAFAGVAVFRLARSVASQPHALAAWAGITLTTPYFMHGWLIYPEMAAACIVAWSLWWTWSDRATGGAPTAWHGAVLGVLPWFHTKFLVLLVFLAAARAMMLLERPKKLLVFTLPIVTSLTAWLWFFYALYGVADPAIPYGGFRELSRDMRWANIPRGLLGFVFDQEFGLLLYSPILFVALAGVIPLMRRRPVARGHFVALIAAAAFLINTTRYYMWWGGWSVPGRFVIPTLPLLAPFLAAGIERLSARNVGRAAVTACLAVSFVTCVVMIANPTQYLMFNVADGAANFVAWLERSTPGLLTSLLPTLRAEAWTGELSRIGVVVGAFSVGLAVLAFTASRATPSANTALLSLRCTLVTLIAFAVLGRTTTSRASMHAITRDGQLSLLNAMDQRRWWDVSRSRPVSHEDLLAGRAIAVYDAELEGRRSTDDPTFAVGPWTLPPGGYEVRVWLRNRRAESGQIMATWHRTRANAARADAAAGPPVALRFDVPQHVQLPPLWVGASTGVLVDEIERVELVPVRLTSKPIGERVLEPVQTENIDQRAGDYILYFDDATFPEQGTFWTTGGATTRVALTAARATRLRLDVETGAGGGTATISVDGDNTVLAMPPNTRRTVDAALTRGLANIEISFTGGFRPSDVAATNDSRWLGVRVTPRVVDSR